MDKQKSDYSEIINKLYDWLKEAASHDVIELMDIIDKAKAYTHAAEELSAEEIRTLENYLLRDFTTFTKQWKSEAEQSPWLAGLKGKLWQLLAALSDANQIQLFEMEMDVAHQGLYQVGEIVSVGLITCNQCGHRHQVDFVEEIQPCIECGGRLFTRSNFD